ncbi:hypothetical protein [Streptomyces sp. NPDC017890]|uniref:hypothetical protein n=1 Tax=Streptomyces sp. NPDC017890 TaxID=3365015 RepID=UPI00379B2673
MSRGDAVPQAVQVFLSGTASNDSNSIAFADQHFTKISGSGLCFANGYFTATYAPVTDGAETVYVN